MHYRFRGNVDHLYSRLFLAREQNFFTGFARGGLPAPPGAERLLHCRGELVERVASVPARRRLLPFAIEYAAVAYHQNLAVLRARQVDPGFIVMIAHAVLHARAFDFVETLPAGPQDRF